MRASAEVVIGRPIDEVFPHAIGLRERGPGATTSPAPIEFVVTVNEPPTRHVVSYTSGPSSFEILTQLEPVGAATKVTHTRSRCGQPASFGPSPTTCSGRCFARR